MRQQDVAWLDGCQRLRKQLLVAELFARQLVTKKAFRRPADMREATGSGCGEQLHRGLAAWRAKQRQRLLSCNQSQSLRRLRNVLAVLRRGPGELATSQCAGRRPHAETRLGALLVAAPIHVVVSVRAELVAFSRPGLPPGCPVVVQAVAVGLRALSRGKKSDPYVLAVEHVGNQRCDAHVAGV